MNNEERESIKNAEVIKEHIKNRPQIKDEINKDNLLEKLVERKMKKGNK